MSVQTLLEGWTDQVPDVIVNGLTLDSREVRPGQAFVAVEGGHTHGLVHARQAVERGAVVVIHDCLTDSPDLAVPSICVPGLGKQLSALGGRFFHDPSDHLTVAGVTGTNGKTSTAHFIAQSWQRAHGNAGMIGTIGYGPVRDLKAGRMTTPDPITLQGMLSACLDDGLERVAMEVSSHALDQGRCDDVAFDVAVFTNLSRDHLDYHGSMEAYVAAKRRLFVDCQPRFAVINCDDSTGKSLIQDPAVEAEVFSYGTTGCGELRASVEHMDSSGMRLRLSSPWGNDEIQTGLLGSFNVSNLMAAAASLALLGMPWGSVMHQLELMHPVPGRMHCLGGEASQPVVVVDYAHTPDALQQALMALRAHLHGRLVCVFGCGGDRDSGKRPMMARIAESLSDRVVMTSDNPRTEDPQAILEDMKAGLQHPARARVIEDRGAAIREAVQQSGRGDIVLVAGKGHEAWQETRNGRIPFSDEAAVLAALEEAA
jgi:UDP-N-acetylmuramoyl-L-alanyl-D-glutamate--2,6-diaminopimelate ligase